MLHAVRQVDQISPQITDGNFLLLRPYHGEHGPKVPVTPSYIVLQRVLRKRECMSILTNNSNKHESYLRWLANYLNITLYPSFAPKLPQILLAALCKRPRSIVRREGLVLRAQVFSISLTAHLRTLAALVRRHRLRERRRQCLEKSRLCGRRHARNLILDCLLSGSPCVGCARPCCRVTLDRSRRLPRRAASLAANLARVPLLHHYVEACRPAPWGPCMSQKLVCFRCRVGKAGCLATTGWLPRLPNAVPPSDVCRGDLECHACFNKLVLELVEV
jgi:hypothetical protein